MGCIDSPERISTGESLATAGAGAWAGSELLLPSPFLGSREILRTLRPLRLAFWGVALLLGAFDAWYPRFSTSTIGPFPDGVSYIDLAWSYARGDWAHALNAYWSPLYSWLLALAFRWLHPSAAAEFPVAHLVNFLIFVAALGCFDFCWRAWLEDQLARTAAASRRDSISLPPWALLALGYTLFTWSAVSLISLQLVSPDLLVAALVYLAAGLMLRLRREGARPGAAALLGAVLACGFLAKAVMLPLAFLFLLLAFLPARNPRRALLSLLWAGIAFGIVALPFVYGLSRQKGRLTFGDTGRLNYAWFVNDALQLDWQGEPPAYGSPAHPTRLIYPSPPVYEFAGPVQGTYPIWTDPSYWNEGLTPRFDARQQAVPLRWAMETTGRPHRPRPYSLIAGVLLLLLIEARVRKRRWPARVRWELFLLALAPTLLYALVVIQTRYLGAQAVLLALAFLPAIRVPANQKSSARVVLATLLILFLPVAGLARIGARDAARRRASRADWAAAVALRKMGIHAGDRVGCIGMSWDVDWARLARVSVVAHIPSPQVDEYWGARPAARAAALNAFAKVGVKAVITRQQPPATAARGWRRLGSTDRYVYLLTR